MELAVPQCTRDKKGFAEDLVVIGKPRSIADRGVGRIITFNIDVRPRSRQCVAQPLVQSSRRACFVEVRQEIRIVSEQIIDRIRQVFPVTSASTY